MTVIGGSNLSARIESAEREAFEAFVSSPPFEYSIERMSHLSAWPGNYRSLSVQLAWEAWKERAEIDKARAAQEAE